MANAAVAHDSIQTENSRERARAARRQAILEAAERVFAERGFGGATMAEIASKAGYSAGNLYNVFENKEALFAEVLTTRAALLLEAVRASLRKGGSLEEIIDRHIDVVVRFVEEYRGFFVILTQTHLDFDWHEPAVSGDDVRDRFDRELEAVFEAAVERGEIPPASARSYVCLVQGTTNSHLARWARKGESAEALLGPTEELRAMIKRGLGLRA
ncbi:MAG: TetR/AcrR family transcriptional regulator [Myxococcota bacterium]